LRTMRGDGRQTGENEREGVRGDRSADESSEKKEHKQLTQSWCKIKQIPRSRKSWGESDQREEKGGATERKRSAAVGKGETCFPLFRGKENSIQKKKISGKGVREGHMSRISARAGAHCSLREKGYFGKQESLAELGEGEDD